MSRCAVVVVVVVVVAAIVVVVAPATVLLTARGGPALENVDLALFLFHEEVDQENLLLVDLQADVFRDVRNQPVHDVAHQHHDILMS